MSTRRRRDGGQGLAEFALVIPLLLIFVLALVDFARGIFIYSVVSDAAREGARYAIVHGALAPLDSMTPSGPGTSDPNGSTYVVPAARSVAQGLDQSLLTIGACWGDRCTVPPDCSAGTNTAASPIEGIPVKVRACYRFNAITATFLGVSSIPLSAEATLSVTH
jgi:hypothetical protein